jgi:hypothetical protein
MTTCAGASPSPREGTDSGGVGAASTPAGTVRRFGGQKFPALVRAGQRVTIALSHRTRRVASLGYGTIHAGGERGVR